MICFINYRMVGFTRLIACTLATTTLFLVVSHAMGETRGPVQAPESLIADFTGGKFGDWRTRGEAFGDVPTKAASDLKNSSLVVTVAASTRFPGRDIAPTGQLLSPTFVITHDFINLRLGGGDHAFRAAASLWVDDEFVRTATGSNDDILRWHTWDVRDLRGCRAWIGIYDFCVQDPHGYVLVDMITQSNTPHAEMSGAIADAIASVEHEAVVAIRRDVDIVAEDPYRPVWHYMPPSHRMNDPHAPDWHDGFHHLFYQHMPFKDSGGTADMHFGHARSRDLVHWETLPLAIRPAYEQGESQCFSGNMARDASGRPVIFYTAVHYVKNLYRRPRAVRAADGDWLSWCRDIRRAPLGLEPAGNPDRNLKDAFPFRADDRTMMVLTDVDNIALYEAVDGPLKKWRYRGVFSEKSVECPNFFHLGKHWVYLSSPHGPVTWAVGEFDAESGSFTPRNQGLINHGEGYYATSAYEDDQGRTILHGLIKGFKNGRGWRGALALPRILTIGPDLTPRMHPVDAIKTLRGELLTTEHSVILQDEVRPISRLVGDVLEIEARIRNIDAKECGLEVRRSADGTRAVPICWRNGELIVAKDYVDSPCRYSLDENELTLRIFLDKAALEVCTGDGRIYESRAIYPPLEDLGVACVARGGRVELVSLKAWQLEPAIPDHELLFAKATRSESDE